MKTVLVTGNEGYIGRVLTGKLIDEGYEVVGLDLGIFKDVEFMPTKHRPTRQIYKDVRDIVPVDLEGIDAVMHLAGLSNDPIGDLNPEITYDINYRASVQLALAAKIAGVKRFLFSSSCSSYGVQGGGYATETSEENPVTPYAISKVKTEQDVSKFADDDFSPVYLRNATVFGVAPRLRLDLVTNSLAAYGYLEGIIAILSDGLPWRPLIHVEDVADAFIFLLEAPRDKVHNEVFNIGSQDINVQIKDIAEIVKDVIPDTIVEIRREHPSDQRSYRVDFSKIYSLGYRPKYNLKEGVVQIYNAYKEARLTDDDFQSQKYITLKRYKALKESGKMNENLRLVD